MVVRHDVDVESIGTMAELPEDMSPLQIGTSGFYKGVRFSIIGRLKIAWESGVWNEWFLYSDDGRKGWLAEAQGSYGVSFELDEPLHPKTEEALNKRFAEFEMQRRITKDGDEDEAQGPLDIGDHIKLQQKMLTVVDVKHATCIGSEGELPFSAPKGRKTLSIDLMGTDGEFACIEIHEGQKRIFVGDYVEWNDLRCDNLRPLEGW
jgi:hypothetical protein